MTCTLSDSVLVLIDFQPSFMVDMRDRDSVLHRAKFLLDCARTLGVPVLVTEQYRDRMGSTDPVLRTLLDGVPQIDKMAFSAMKSPEFVAQLESLGRRQVILCGIETHICVMQTCLHLLEQGYSVAVAHDAVTGRLPDATVAGFQRMRHAGATVAHSESVVYEWMESASHPLFRDVLKIVKQYSVG